MTGSVMKELSMVSSSDLWSERLLMKSIVKKKKKKKNFFVVTSVVTL